MTSKVLSDPRQRRFFKPKDMRDLFQLGNETEEGTETGDIFAGTGAKEITRPSFQNQMETENGQDGTEPTEEHHENKPETGTAGLLNSLLEDLGGGQLHSTINHDAVLGAGSEVKDRDLMEYEADKVAEEAMKEISRSAQQRRRQGVAVPTWTGRSGLAGLVTSKNNPGQSNGSTAASLLQKMRRREGIASPLKGTTQNTSLTQSGSLLHDVILFLRTRRGQATSATLVDHFRERVDKTPEGLQTFKSLLKRVARLVKGAGPDGASVWQLLDELPEV